MYIGNIAKIKENKSTFSLSDMIHICKRENNSKRDFLFVNKYLGKHHPCKAKDTIRLFSEFYKELSNNYKLNNQRILLIGFAETATGLSQYVMHRSLLDKNLNIVYYIQTTREDINTDIKAINFQEEHSHAKSQTLYWNTEEIPEFDYILFIDDEVTTGKTICNFINKININTNYAVGSILNWLSTENKEKLKAELIYLINGELHDRIPILFPKKNTKVNNFNESLNYNYTLPSEDNPRLGMTPKQFKNYLGYYYNLLNKYSTTIARKSINVLGTEENNYKAILLAYLYNGTVQSFTRSPIVTADDYFIQNGIIINSSYESNRKNFLYNIKEYDKVFLLAETNNKEWENEVLNIFPNLEVKHLQEEKI